MVQMTRLSSRTPFARLRMIRTRDHGGLGSTGCQPVHFGSLPRLREAAVARNFACTDVADRAAGNHRLAACAPQNAATQYRPVA